MSIVNLTFLQEKPSQDHAATSHLAGGSSLGHQAPGPLGLAGPPQLLMGHQAPGPLTNLAQQQQQMGGPQPVVLGPHQAPANHLPPQLNHHGQQQQQQPIMMAAAPIHRPFLFAIHRQACW